VNDGLVAQFQRKLAAAPAAKKAPIQAPDHEFTTANATSAASEDPRRMRVTHASCGIFEDLDPQALGVSVTFDTPASGPPFDLPISIIGSRIVDVDTASPAAPVDGEPTQFSVVHTIKALPTGLGRVSATVRIPQATSGRWRVRAQADPLVTSIQASGTTAYRPFVNVAAPGVLIGAWPFMVAVGALAGSLVLAWLASRVGISLLDIVWLALASCVVGAVGAKLYFLAETRNMAAARSGAGMCLQGFVIASLATFVIGTRVLGLPTLMLLNLTTPGLLIGMALGRLGCWAGGCCVGRLSSGRFAVWSSDRSIGARRIPTQLLESSAALILAIVTLLVILNDPKAPGASVLALGLGAYILVRQLLFPLRSQPRKTKLGRPIVMTVAATAVLYASAVLAVGSTSL